MPSHRRPVEGGVLGTSNYSWHHTPTGRPEPDGRRALSVVALGLLLVGAGGYLIGHHTHLWQLLLAPLAIGAGLFVWTSYVAWIFRYKLNNERWARTRPRRAARWALVNVWWVAWTAASAVAVTMWALGRLD